MPQWLSFGDQDRDGAFPRLKRLHLENCPKLMGLPQKLPSLLELVVIKCQGLEATVPVTICKLKLEHSQKVSMGQPLPQLQQLSINEYDALDLLLAGTDNENSCIEKLSISNCPMIFKLPADGISGNFPLIFRCFCVDSMWQRRTFINFYQMILLKIGQHLALGISAGTEWSASNVMFFARPEPSIVVSIVLLGYT
ncbi:hypothetical protein L6164_023093 [Bauhinia variegata]|uniref:Uncharacterized protein n=1 Tax=Bauhinia variegata TaxID=167791 RepID=A0ACB9MKN0_BAUVA|nr:hypothetical protein L6164_023093 [Bauhinia variegata]